MEQRRWFLVKRHDESGSRLVYGFRKHYGTNQGYFSIGISYETPEELIAKEKVEPEPCTCCGTIYKTNYNDPTGSQLRERKICFDCNFWMEQYNRNKRHIVLNDGLYADGGKVEKGTRGFVGFGGHEWKIEFPDGEILETNNMWHQGTIPKHFRHLFPPNARQIPPEPRKFNFNLNSN